MKTCSLLLGVSRPWTIFRQLIRKFSFGYPYEENCLCHGMRGRCHHGFMLQILCLFLWRHIENISALLLRRCFLSDFIIHSFSSRQSTPSFPSKHTFISFDIVDFYPCDISEELLDKAISWATNHRPRYLHHQTRAQVTLIQRWKTMGET